MNVALNSNMAWIHGYQFVGFQLGPSLVLMNCSLEIYNKKALRWNTGKWNYEQPRILVGKSYRVTDRLWLEGTLNIISFPLPRIDSVSERYSHMSEKTEEVATNINTAGQLTLFTAVYWIFLNNAKKISAALKTKHGMKYNI